MITVKPTEHLTGVIIEGDFNDLYNLVESIYRITGSEDEAEDIFYGVKNRLLGMCYDIRHAYQGDRNVLVIDNGMDETTMKWHEIITPKHNVYYSVELLFPESLFIATAVPKMCVYSYRYYGNKNHKDSEEINRVHPMSQYYLDKAYLDVLCTSIWHALGMAIGEDEVEKLLCSKERSNEDYSNYITHYIDKCNLELIKTPVEKRKDKLKNITKRIIKKPKAYYSMESDLKYWVKEYDTNIYELSDPSLEYPENIEW